MGALFGGGGQSISSPPPPPPLPPAAAPPTLANPASAVSGAVQRQRASGAAGAGFDSTLTNTGGSLGQPTPSTAQRSLLG